MTRVAVVVEPEFLGRHVGVRNLLFALKAVLGPAARVDFVWSDRPAGGRRHWSRTALRDRFALPDAPSESPRPKRFPRADSGDRPSRPPAADDTAQGSDS